MADVYAIFGTLLALGIAFPGFLTAWWLLFPDAAAAAGERLVRAPWRSLGVGAVVGVLLTLVTTILLSAPLPFARPLGAFIAVLGLALAAVGAAGLVARMAVRLRGGATTASFGAFVLAAICLELAAVFPFIGWFLVLPVTVAMSLGAAVGVLRRSRGRLRVAQGGPGDAPDSPAAA